MPCAADEIGPADISESNAEDVSPGAGWHVIFTLLSR